jgi:hypothetical protein
LPQRQAKTGIRENIQVDEYEQDLRISGRSSTSSLLLGVDVIFQNFSLMENDTGSHKIVPRLDGVMAGIQIHLHFNRCDLEK